MHQDISKMDKAVEKCNALEQLSPFKRQTIRQFASEAGLKCNTLANRLSG